MPKASAGGARAVQNGLVLVSNLDVGCSEGNIAAGIAKLANGKEGVGCKVRDNVDLASVRWEVGQVQVSNMGGVHDAAIGVADGKGSGIGTLVNNREVNGAKMSSTSSIGD